GRARAPERRAGGCAQRAGRPRRARREDPHLQLPAGPGHRPPGRRQCTAPGRPRRRPRRVHRRSHRRRAAPRARGRRRLTLGEVLTRTSDYFAGKGIETARLDAELILARGLGLTRLELYTSFDKPLTEAELAAVRPLVERRGKREPLAYVLGDWGFRRLTLKTDSRALVPRPETEMVVERALAAIAAIEAPRV